MAKAAFLSLALAETGAASIHAIDAAEALAATSSGDSDVPATPSGCPSDAAEANPAPGDGLSSSSASAPDRLTGVNSGSGALNPWAMGSTAADQALRDLSSRLISNALIPGALGNIAPSAKGGSSGGGGGGGGGGGSTTPTIYIAGATGAYNIELTFLGDGWNLYPEFYNQAKAMADLICSFIVEDIANYTLQYRQGPNIITDSIDDVEMNLTLKTIDGTGGILGQAGPDYWRPTNDGGDYHLILEGSIELDSADALTFLNANLFDDILFHEMLHVIGVGTLWSDKQVINGYTYTGTEGKDAYRLSGFTSTNNDPPLVEDDGGSGTAGGHWEEGTDRLAMNPTGFSTVDPDSRFNSTAGSEIMTGYINATNWLSWVTIASLEDLGYGTIWDTNRTSPINPIALSEIKPNATI